MCPDSATAVALSTRDPNIIPCLRFFFSSSVSRSAEFAAPFRRQRSKKNTAPSDETTRRFSFSPWSDNRVRLQISALVGKRVLLERRSGRRAGVAAPDHKWERSRLLRISALRRPKNRVTSGDVLWNLRRDFFVISSVIRVLGRCGKPDGARGWEAWYIYVCVGGGRTA